MVLPTRVTAVPLQMVKQHRRHPVVWGHLRQTSVRRVVCNHLTLVRSGVLEPKVKRLQMGRCRKWAVVAKPVVWTLVQMRMQSRQIVVAET